MGASFVPCPTVYPTRHLTPAAPRPRPLVDVKTRTEERIGEGGTRLALRANADVLPLGLGIVLWGVNSAPRRNRRSAGPLFSLGLGMADSAPHRNRRGAGPPFPLGLGTLFGGINSAPPRNHRGAGPLCSL